MVMMMALVDAYDSIMMDDKAELQTVLGLIEQ